MNDLLEKYDKTYEKVRKYLICKEEPEVEIAVKWLDKVMQYNVINGKKTRALFLINAYKHFAKIDDLNDKRVELSCVVACCIEIMHAFLLIVDDIIDQSSMRRGQQCWYLKERIDFIAINDALLLQHSVYEVLRNYISGQDYYLNVLHLFGSICFETSLGQCMDCKTTPNASKTNFSLLNQSHYEKIVKYKTTLFTFELPVRLALLMAGIHDKLILNEVRSILLRLGHLYQTQDDFLDCYGDPEITGEIGTDIQNGKCCWLAVEAMKRMTIDETEIFRENYGIKDEESVAVIKSLYDKMDLKGIFIEFEEKEYNEIKKQISEFGNQSIIDVKPFYNILDFIYKREK